jgi:MFS family permease
MFHGWIVVGGAFLVLLVGFGITYSFGTFFAPLQQEFGATRGAISLVFALGALAYFAVGVVSGPFADRFGPRRIGLVGILALGLGMIAASRATSLIQVYIAYTIAVGIGVGCIYVPSVSAVQRWFTRRRGLASGLAVSGIGVGTLIMPPIAGAMIGAVGWRSTWLALGIAGLVAARPASRRHGRTGREPCGDPPLCAQGGAGDPALPAAVWRHVPRLVRHLRAVRAYRGIRA